MTDQTVKYLKVDRGRYFYRRRVPQRHQKTLGQKIWNQPCGDVSYQKAVVLVTGWAEEHDELIISLNDPSKTTTVRQATEAKTMAPAVAGMIAAQQARVLPDTFDPLEAAIAGLKAADQNPDYDNQDRLIRYHAILESSFGSHVAVPRDPDEKDKFELVKRKLERRISDIAGSPNTISSVAARYYAHNVIKPGAQAKYRRNMALLH